MLGLGLYTVGLITEFAVEVDRKGFKSKLEREQGKVVWWWTVALGFEYQLCWIYALEGLVT